jgi:hypothetical protein
MTMNLKKVEGGRRSGEVKVFIYIFLIYINYLALPQLCAKHGESWGKSAARDEALMGAIYGRGTGNMFSRARDRAMKCAVVT